jgi:anti-sigma B factor antagonist
MELEISENTLSEKSVLLKIVGRLNATSTQKLKTRLKQLVDGNKTELILDMRAVSFIDSSGLASLVSGLKLARERGGWLKLAGVNEQVASIFKMTLLDRVFELYPNVEAAQK